jgi:mannose-6-phosphate isomerase-like protein (cupin superfamily)
VFTQMIGSSPQNRRGGGQVSHLLLAPGQFGSRNLAVTWVEGIPGSQQPLHAHPDCEQVYVVVAGWGRMIVDGEEQDVQPRTLVFVPPGTEHAIRNPGPGNLVYVSATSPPFPTPEGEFAYQPAERGSGQST